MSNFYKFEQRPIDNFYQYDENLGISRLVLIEAETADQANERAMGIIDDLRKKKKEREKRWNFVAEYYRWQGIIPETDALLVYDENLAFRRRPHDILIGRQMAPDQFEMFLHPLDGTFYGTYRRFKRIPRTLTGWGLAFTQFSRTEVVAVGDDGFNADATIGVPAPGSMHEATRFDETPVHTDNLRVVKTNILGRIEYTVWSPDRQIVEKIAANMDAYYARVPNMDESSFFVV